MNGFFQPGRGDVHLDVALSNFSVAVRQSLDGFIADKAFPVVTVSNQTNKYWVIPPDKFLLDDMQKRAPGTEVPGANYTTSTDNYLCDVFHAGHYIPDEVRDNADSQINLEQLGVRLLTYKAMIKKERAWAADFFATSVWTGDQTGVANGSPGANQFGQWDRDDSDPIRVIRAQADAMQARTGLRPNKLILGRQVFSKLLDHPDLIDRVKYGQVPGAPAQMSKQALASMFEVDNLLVMEAVYNSAAEGQTASVGFIGGKSALLLYVDPAPGLQAITAGVTFAWNGSLQGINSGMAVSRQRLPSKHSDVLEMFMAWDQKKTVADLGVFFASAVA